MAVSSSPNQGASARQGPLRLSAQEHAVLSLSSAGLSDKEIAQKLCIQIDTVRTYWKRVKLKLDSKTRGESIACFASREGDILIEENQVLSEEILRRRAAETLLAERKARFRTLCEVAIHGMFSGDEEGNCTYVNPACEKLVGFAACDLMGWGWLPRLVSAESVRQLRLFTISLRREGSGLARFEVLCGDGIRRTIQVSARRVFSGDHAIGYVGHVEDITRSEELERELREVREFAECVALATDDIVYVYDIASGKNIYMNQATEAVLGMSKEQVRELGAKATFSIIDPRDHPALLDARKQYVALGPGESISLRCRATSADGRRYIFAGKTVVLRRDSMGVPKQMLGVLKVTPDDTDSTPAD